jgi:hypothetical protein
MSNASKSSSCGHQKPLDPLAAVKSRTRVGAPPAAQVRSKRRVALACGVAGLFLLSAGILAVADLRHAWGQSPAPKQGAEPAPAKWVILFRADDPALWNTSTKGKAIPVRHAPFKTRYLRLRRMDTGEALILPLTYDQLQNGKAPGPEVRFWWNGTAKEDWKGRHLGIVEAPRHKFPAPNGMMTVMTVGWDAWTGSGFAHKAFVNDGQYYSWRGQEIRRTAFEIAVTEGPLSPDERRCLLAPR